MMDDFDGFFGGFEDCWEPVDDLQEFSDREAWEDMRADMMSEAEDSEDLELDPNDPDVCSCGRDYREEQYDFYGIYCGKMCDECFREKYRQDAYFDAGYAGESLEPEDY